MKSTFNHDNWQQALIETNLLIIGFNAWNGYLKAGRGAVICSTNYPLLDRFGETFKTYFVPRPRLAAFLNAWLAAPDTAIFQGHFINSHILEAKVSSLVRDKEFRSEFSDRIGEPSEIETEDEFVKRGSSILRKMLYDRFGIKY